MSSHFCKNNYLYAEKRRNKAACNTARGTSKRTRKVGY